MKAILWISTEMGYTSKNTMHEFFMHVLLYISVFFHFCTFFGLVCFANIFSCLLCRFLLCRCLSLLMLVLRMVPPAVPGTCLLHAGWFIILMVRSEERLPYLGKLYETHRFAALVIEAQKKWVKAHFDQTVSPRTFVEGDLVLLYDKLMISWG